MGTQGCVLGLGSGLGRAFAAPAAAPPRRPPPPFAPPLLRALRRRRALLLRPALLRRRPRVSSSAAAPVMRGGRSQRGCVRRQPAAKQAGCGVSGQGHARAHSGPRQGHSGPRQGHGGPGWTELYDCRRRACWCETACGPSRAGCAAVMPRASSSGSAPACRSRTGIVRLPAQSEHGLYRAWRGAGQGRQGLCGLHSRSFSSSAYTTVIDGGSYVRPKDLGTGSEADISRRVGRVAQPKRWSRGPGIRRVQGEITH